MNIHRIHFQSKYGCIRVVRVAVIFSYAEAGAEAHIRSILSVDFLTAAEPLVKFITDVHGQFVIGDQLRFIGRVTQLMLILLMRHNTFRINTEQRYQAVVIGVDADGRGIFMQQVTQVILVLQNPAHDGLEALIAKVFHRSPARQRAGRRTGDLQRVVQRVVRGARLQIGGARTFQDAFKLFRVAVGEAAAGVGVSRLYGSQSRWRQRISSPAARGSWPR